MEPLYTEERTFDKNDFTVNPLPKGEYEYRVFKNCDFSNSDLKKLFSKELTSELPLIIQLTPKITT